MGGIAILGLAAEQKCLYSRRPLAVNGEESIAMFFFFYGICLSLGIRDAKYGRRS